jgi:deazaflavin-dependent oxidoreductase (nitroreductase family)
MAGAWLEQHVGDDFCYLTTVGRRTGRAHEIENWFGVLDGALYMRAGGREGADWVRNVMKTPAVTVRIGDEVRKGHGRVIDAATEPDLDGRVRRVVAEKYGELEADGALSGWGKTALPVEVRFEE